MSDITEEMVERYKAAYGKYMEESLYGFIPSQNNEISREATRLGLEAALSVPAPVEAETQGSFKLGDRVRKIKGSSWQGKVVGFYSTALTPVGYCVESEREPGSVQLYPEAALEPVSNGGTDG